MHITPPFAPGRFVLDPVGSSIAVRHKTLWGLATVRATLEVVSGDGRIEPHGTAVGVVTIDATSIDSNHAKCDARLRSDDFFAAERFPLIRFDVLGAAHGKAGTVSVEGRLTVRGVTQPQGLTALITALEPTAITLLTEFSVDRTDFGITRNKMALLRGSAIITAALRFTRAAACRRKITTGVDRTPLQPTREPSGLA
jgi:polyisoprenoid-binding protein YceI